MLVRNTKKDWNHSTTSSSETLTLEFSTHMSSFERPLCLIYNDQTMKSQSSTGLTEPATQVLPCRICTQCEAEDVWSSCSPAWLPPPPPWWGPPPDISHRRIHRPTFYQDETFLLSWCPSHLQKWHGLFSEWTSEWETIYIILYWRCGQ